ncbi:hypothetical protein [Rhizobacter sp. Root1221]|uniref:hypothetical protein n=1 Tax=Rhizobacter sp. Root1221 TaxID=1736433 RepID=UPI0007005D94|nr:hypothetical protein [Rhizobacter sp. Root1221]KQV82944.1 hypothetical protein ASC87_08280 [Rhizobacter sp. Root1221]
MATVRLDIEIDSEVYPELHAALAGMRSARTRGERMRQLAAAGLVWENVRIHGAAAIGPTPAAHQRPSPPTLDDFIDLAIDAVPEPAANPMSAPEPRVAERLVARPLPVLMDVVPDVAPEPDPTSAPPEAHDTGDPLVHHADDTLHLVSLAQKPASRSRLMRMKDKGLFKNG